MYYCNAKLINQIPPELLAAASVDDGVHGGVGPAQPGNNTRNQFSVLAQQGLYNVQCTVYCRTEVVAFNKSLRATQVWTWTDPGFDSQLNAKFCLTHDVIDRVTGHEANYLTNDVHCSSH